MQKLIEIFEHTEPGYKSLIFFEGWRIALMNFQDNMVREKITYLERHDKTDEVFVLIKGECALYIGDGSDQVGNITLFVMEPERLYNVKKGVWHNIIGKPLSSWLIVENADTSIENSQRQVVNTRQLPIWK